MSELGCVLARADAGKLKVIEEARPKSDLGQLLVEVTAKTVSLGTELGDGVPGLDVRDRVACVGDSHAEHATHASVTCPGNPLDGPCRGLLRRANCRPIRSGLGNLVVRSVAKTGASFHDEAWKHGTDSRRFC